MHFAGVARFMAVRIFRGLKADEHVVIVLLRRLPPLFGDARNILRPFYIALAQFFRFGKLNRHIIFVGIAKIFVCALIARRHCLAIQIDFELNAEL